MLFSDARCTTEECLDYTRMCESQTVTSLECDCPLPCEESVFQYTFSSNKLLSKNYKVSQPVGVDGLKTVRLEALLHRQRERHRV
jgi:hypothetical protein